MKKMQTKGNSEYLTDKNIMTVTFALFIVLVIGSLFLENSKIYILGLLFGTALSVINFRLLKLTLERSVKLPANKINKYIVSRYILRYVIKAVALFTGFMYDGMNAIAVILGLLILNFSIYIINFFGIFQKKVSKE